MTVRIPPKSPGGRSEVFAIDFRETAPAASTPDMFVKNPGLAEFGGLVVGVPGEPRGLEEAHKRWGKLKWDRLIAPSIKLARGWEVDPELADRLTVRIPSISYQKP
jgi:gamma-glutamyltranspeptidase/glutathione hydrolase/leukotriene-C4 hydrolase